ncbi:MAG TPA: rhomboid family intramembrane serine protease [Flavobacteriales bacterium]|nr:rhomboid family intramembrane serine protease [Flavobacteriales bacterium]HNU57438.1 rhomboid family intramembrane serine protease [Flavobacteriales bacterium]
MRYNASPFAGLPVVVKNLLIINGIVFLLKLTGLGNFGGTDMDTLFGLHFFASPLFKPWQLITHMFMHGGFAHLALNMLGLFMLAPPLEYKWGSQRFLSFYLITGIGAALFYSGVHAIEYGQLVQSISADQLAILKQNGAELWAQRQNYVDPTLGRINEILNIPMVGASGAIYGVLLAFGMTFPNVELIMFPLPIPIKAKYFVLILGGLSLFNSLDTNPGDNIAHLAHLGGMVVGFILVKLWKDRGDNGFGWDR